MYRIDKNGMMQTVGRIKDSSHTRLDSTINSNSNNNVARENYAFWIIQDIIDREIKKAFKIRV